MNFSSLVLIEKNPETNMIVKEIGSYEVGEGAEYINKFFYDGSEVSVVFDTLKDVEEWEYSAIFDLFEDTAFSENNFTIEDVDDEYNPTWIVKFDYIEDHMEMQERVNLLCELIKASLEKVFLDISGKEEEYK